MRCPLLLSLVLAGVTCADDVRDNPPVRVTEAPNPRLEEVLLGWAKASISAKQFRRTARMTLHDRVLQSVETGSIDVYCCKPDLLRVDHMDEKGNPKEVVYCKGKEIHFFSGGQEHVFRLSDAFGFPDNPERYPNTFLERFTGVLLEQASCLTVGFPVRTLRDRFDVRLTKEDEQWVYLELRPRRSRDKEWYDLVQIVLHRKELWVRRVFTRQPNKNEITYDFEKPDTSKPVTVESIVKGLPVGWKRVECPDPATTP
jgi:TIGR03009 family protein